MKPCSPSLYQWLYIRLWCAGGCYSVAVRQLDNQCLKPEGEQQQGGNVLFANQLTQVLADGSYRVQLVSY